MVAETLMGEVFNWKASQQLSKIEGKIYDLVKRCKAHKECKEDPEPDPPPKPYPNNVSIFRSMTPIMDPSGFVYEAVASNRVEGVTATLYEKTEWGGEQVWDASEYQQVNPFITNDYGMYYWDVPIGEWQVRFAKAGYQSTRSEWLPVPPPQFDVNIPLVSYAPPTVVRVEGKTGAIEVEFSKYMEIFGISAENILVTKNGQPVSGRIELVNAEAPPTDASLQYASIVRFIPDAPFTAGDDVWLTVKAAVTSYAGVALGADVSRKVEIAHEAFLNGDTDGDGEVTDWDAILLCRYMAGWKVTIDLRAADIDHDGEVTDWDAILLERYLAGWPVVL
jgi:hypothetical protein